MSSSYEDSKQWRKSVKPGDTVTRLSIMFGSKRDLKVARVTPKQIILVDGGRFWIESGGCIPRDRFFRIEQPKESS